MALEKTEIGIRKETSRKSAFSSQDPGKILEPHQEKKLSSKPRSKFRSNRVHHVDDVYGWDPEEAEDYAPDPYAEEGDPQEAEQAEQA